MKGCCSYPHPRRTRIWYAREFLTRIADLGLRWMGHASVNLASDPEMLELCQRSGCMGVLIGFETLSAETKAADASTP